MKKSDIAGIMLIVTITMVVVYTVVRALLGGQQIQEAVTVESIQPLPADVDSPDAKIFYKGAINPTVKVQTGTGTLEQPR
jgi:hypothetical protein